MSTFTTLSQPDEDDLHAKRLLNIEEKSYKRIQKRLLAPTNPIQTYLRRPATDPSTSHSDENTTSDADLEDGVTTSETPNGTTQQDTKVYLKDLQTFTHQTLHDFSSLTTSLARLQFLLTANTSERERYTTQTTTITTQHAEITSETTLLRSRLDEARSRLEQRKQYDELAKKVLYVNGREGTRRKTREELGRESERLKSEIEELEREGDELRGQWRERREGLSRVNGETERLRRVVRGEMEVVEREGREEEVRSEDGAEVDDEETGEKRREEDEGNTQQERHGDGDGDDHHDEDQDQEDDMMLGVTDRDGGASNSNMGTPRPLDDAPTPIPIVATGESGGMTPLPAGAMTPLSTGEHEDDVASPRPGTATGGSALKQEVFNEGSSALGGDTPMADLQHDEGVIDVPEVRAEGEDKANTEGMDIS